MSEKEIVKKQAVPKEVVELAKVLNKVSVDIKEALDKVESGLANNLHFISVTAVFLGQLDNLLKAKESANLLNKMESALKSPDESFVLCQALGKFAPQKAK